DHFANRQRLADADMRSSAEWDPGVLGNVLNAARCKALGVEAFRILEKSRIALRDPWENIDPTTGRDRIAAQLDIGLGDPGDERPHWRVQAQRLADNHFGVAEFRQIAG